MYYALYNTHVLLYIDLEMYLPLYIRVNDAWSKYPSQLTLIFYNH